MVIHRETSGSLTGICDQNPQRSGLRTVVQLRKAGACGPLLCTKNPIQLVRLNTAILCLVSMRKLRLELVDLKILLDPRLTLRRRCAQLERSAGYMCYYLQ
jgi:hypothetical protein